MVLAPDVLDRIDEPLRGRVEAFAGKMLETYAARPLSGLRAALNDRA